MTLRLGSLAVVCRESRGNVRNYDRGGVCGNPWFHRALVVDATPSPPLVTLNPLRRTWCLCGYVQWCLFNFFLFRPRLFNDPKGVSNRAGQDHPALPYRITGANCQYTVGS